MADYKRIVSYMYQYNKGVKGRNVGYARAETRNGQCKITLRLQILGQLDSIFPTYLIRREQNGMDLIYLGDSVLKSNVMDSKHLTEEDSIKGTSYKFSDFSGILIFLDEDTFYATVWDDIPVIYEEVMKAMDGEEESNPSDRLVDDYDKKPTENEDAVFADEMTEKEETETSDQLAEKEETETSDQLSEKEETETSDQLAEKEESQLSDQLTEKDDKVLADKGTEKEGKELTNEAKETIKERVSDEREHQLEEFLDTMDPLKMVEHQRLEEGQESNNPSVELDEGIDMDQLYRAPQKQQIDKELKAKLINHSQGMNDQIAKVEVKLQRIFDRYPRMNPFEDHEIIQCVKIEPKDIGLLPLEYWTFSNNSFLLHGYYCYQHIIVAKMRDRFGSRYIIGVPGIYHNREKFMARMFGFHLFKATKVQEPKQGDFGYWYVPINL